LLLTRHIRLFFATHPNRLRSVSGAGWPNAAHGDNLAFVVKDVRQDVVQNEGWGPDEEMAVGEPKFCRSVELLIGQAGQIRQRAAADLLPLQLTAIPELL